VAAYIAEHPELDTAAKKTKAEEILNRAKAGEDFAALANEFSEDPGNKDPKTGEGKGGLYSDTPKGRMVAPFEQAALSVEPGQVVPNLVETDFGYHIIKLEKKGEGKDPSGETTEIYDVRHILISTGVKDPENPMGREVPAKAYARQKLEEQKEKALIEEIVARNNVKVPADFDVPEVSEAQIQEMMKRQQQMPMGMEPGEIPSGEGEEAEAPAAKTAPNKPAPKKK
ncbi:MAG: peptidyl-prolyl cis-trans isomerase, partial [Acidobacteria bacterium]|nr:peptidyl-prolyl cis-trans isomerase [Acidobacteriota bacterium]